jgi:xanthine dehydrogenase accessory factor
MNETLVAESIWQNLANMPAHQRSLLSGRVLALVLRTEASTYQKAGAIAVLDGTRVVAGTVSGGCLESDLALRVADFLQYDDTNGAQTGRRELRCGGPFWSYVRYDTRNASDDVLGTALGCRGALDIALLRMDDPGVAQFFHTAWSACSGTSGICSLDESLRLSLKSVSDSGNSSALTTEFDLAQCVDAPSEAMQDLAAALSTHPLVLRKRRRALLCGCGPDAPPLVSLLIELGFELTLVDHRPEFLERVHAKALELCLDENGIGFSNAVTAVGASRLVTGAHAVVGYDAVMIMSHHLEWDGRYLDAVRALDPRRCYIGLLGPATRRKEVFGLLSDRHPLDVPELHSPMGFKFATRGPTAVAVGIIAELLQQLH